MKKEGIKQSFKIYYIGNHATIIFAAEELMKYLVRMMDNTISINIEKRDNYDNALNDGIWVGLLDDLDLVNSLQVNNSEFEDAVSIDVEKGRGVIGGVNARSVLLAVYRFLTETGCKWIRPGKDGELIPRQDIMQLKVNINEKPSYRHRGVCIEGAVSYENVADMIDFIPKLGFNSYFIQFRESYNFFERWYLHRHNDKIDPEQTFSVEKAREFVNRLINEIKKRDLIYHAVGHGWTCEPLGIPGLGWDQKVYEVNENISSYLAKVDGKREMWRGVPIDTNLCYSNPEVRKLIVDDVVNYLKENKEIDLLHFWLADSYNNQCECDRCKDIIPSDWYVKMLNELDELLTSNGIDTKIIFLVYFDLLWAPEFELIKNHDRFILMFAPLKRTYSRSYSTKEYCYDLTPYERNKIKPPSSVEENLGFLREWQKIFDGDSFDYDYHLFHAHYSDPSYYQISKVLHEDIKSLKKIQLNGFISCQAQRVFYPTGLPMYVMGKTLWDDQQGFDTISDEYFYTAFGDDGLKCRDYLEELSVLFAPLYSREEKPQIDLKAAKDYSHIHGVIERFQAVIQKNLSNWDECKNKSWEYLNIHAQMCILLAKLLESKAMGNESVESLWDELKNFVCAYESLLQPVFDVYEFIEYMNLYVL